MLDGFIKKFVLCEKCENPETVIKVKKNLIGASCRACGHTYVMDMRHKLTTFIVKVCSVNRYIIYFSDIFICHFIIFGS